MTGAVSLSKVLDQNFVIPARGQAQSTSLLNSGRSPAAAPAFSNSSARHGAGAAGAAANLSLAPRHRFQFEGAA